MRKVSSVLVLCTTTTALFTSACSDANMQKTSDGKYVVNTTELGKSVAGFAGQTPLEVTIDNNGQIVAVTALENGETKSYFDEVSTKMLPAFVGKNAATVGSVDGVSGATFSSRAVKENVQIALDYYQQHK